MASPKSDLPQGSHDLTTFATVIAVLSLTGVIATLIPTLTAIRVDPLRALRNE
jgi:ABC-type lipoprotein release transport system permease subunit